MFNCEICGEPLENFTCTNEHEKWHMRALFALVLNSRAARELRTYFEAR